MQQASLLTADYLDILYTDRNKAYGSYELRKHYNQRAGKALGAMLALCILAIGYAAVPQKKEQSVAISEVKPVVDLFEYNPQPMPELPQPEPISPAQTNVATVDCTTPRIVTDTDIPESEVPPVTETEGKEIGKDNIEGEATNSDMGSSKTTKGGGGSSNNGATTPPAEPPFVTYASIMPSFNGELMEYLGKNLRYPDAARDANVEGRVTVQFIVDESGNISNAKVIRGIGAGCDEEALRVVNKMPRWKPGRQNDKAVKVLLTLPIVFQLQ